MSTEVLYRKWRPRTFAEVAGQESVVRTLTNAIAAGKVAHAYLFSGPRGTGKTTSGRLLAKAVNCANPEAGEPCNTCESCQAYLEGRALDLIELDAASNRGIDEIRSLREKANFAPAGGSEARKVYLVDEVHMLTEPAFNALLKTLEEPPAHVIFVLATTESHKVPATVISRCQRFDFRRIPLAAVVERLSFIAEQEEIECPKEGLEVIARTATGSLRDAINLLEQLVDSYGKQVSLEQVREGLGLIVDARSGDLSAHVLRGELAEGLGLIASVRDDGLDLRQFQRQVVAHLRGLLLTKANASASDTWSEDQLAQMRTLVADVPAERIVAALRAFGEADLRADPLSPLPLELALASSVLRETAAPAPTAATSQASPMPRPVTETPRQPARRPAAPKAEAKEPGAVKPAPVAVAASPEPPAEAVPTKVASSPEEPVVAATPAVTPSNDVEPALAEARGRWQAIYERARELHYRAGALLNSGCGIIQASEGEIVFGFRHAMLLDRMQGDGGENLRALQQAVDDVLGAGRTVRCVLEPNVDVQRPARGGHLVRAAEEMGGHVLSNDD
ncbi:MAG: DNA polymerase III subunit gamma/tau [Chloroflexi bacterium]|nr:DNA polymerase III subunit gamma/tau [Chloroflexota bacterium]